MPRVPTPTHPPPGMRGPAINFLEAQTDARAPPESQAPGRFYQESLAPETQAAPCPQQLPCLPWGPACRYFKQAPELTKGCTCTQGWDTRFQTPTDTRTTPQPEARKPRGQSLPVWQTEERPQGEPVLTPSPATVFPCMMKGTSQVQLRTIREWLSSITGERGDG